MSINWRGISSNPNDPTAIAMVSNHLNEIIRYFEGTKNELILNHFAGKIALDIGSAGHVIKGNIEEWQHENLKKVTKSILGIEIEKDKCDYYNSLGYSFLNMDACSEIFIGKNFDAIYCGDVIEHVNDPVKLLRFISRHLNDDGAAILSTPNPFYSGFNKLRALRKESFYTPNLSHISWITPANMLEICYRSGLFLETIYIPEISRSISVQYNYALELAFHEYIFLIRAKVR